jgi:hypothetical protein
MQLEALRAWYNWMKFVGIERKGNEIDIAGYKILQFLGDWRWAADKYSCNLANKAKACNDESALFHDLLDCARALADIRQHEVPAVLCNYPQQS